MAYPQPTEVAPWYLRNITQALELDQATGNVFVRTNAVLAGNVSVGNVAIGINAGTTFDLIPYNFSLAAGDTLSVFISSGSAINRTSCGLTWRVD